MWDVDVLGLARRKMGINHLGGKMIFTSKQWNEKLPCILDTQQYGGEDKKREKSIGM